METAKNYLMGLNFLSAIIVTSFLQEVTNKKDKDTLKIVLVFLE